MTVAGVHNKASGPSHLIISATVSPLRPPLAGFSPHPLFLKLTFYLTCNGTEEGMGKSALRPVLLSWLMVYMGYVMVYKRCMMVHMVYICPHEVVVYTKVWELCLHGSREGSNDGK